MYLHYLLNCRSKMLYSYVYFYFNLCTLRLEQKLKVTERKHGIPQRWTPDSPSYQAMDRLQMEQSKHDAFAKLEQSARERWFLLTLQAKYAGMYMCIIFYNFAYDTCHYGILHNISDGQYMASRISRGIQQETQKLKRLLHEYNQLVSDHLSWKDVTDLSSSIWNPTDGNNVTLPPRSIRLAAIDAYVKKLRATEEKELLKTDMCNVISFYLNQYNDITRLLDSFHSSSEFGRGCLVLLNKNLSECKKRLFNNYSAFKDYAQLPQIPEELMLHAYLPDLDLVKYVAV